MLDRTERGAGDGLTETAMAGRDEDDRIDRLADEEMVRRLAVWERGIADRRATAPIKPPTEGWAQRSVVGSIVWHYFRAGVSLCADHWTDALEPFVVVVPPARGWGCAACLTVVQGRT